MKINLNELLKKVESKKTEIEINKRELKKIELNLKQEEKKYSDLDKLKEVIMTFSEESKNEMIEYIEDLVSSCLSSTFGNKYTFEIQAEEKHNQQEYHFYLNRNGLLLEPREDMCGDSLLDICNVGIRTASMVIDPTIEPVFLWDQPFTNLRHDKKPFVKDLIKELSNELDIQFIIINHDEFYMSMGNQIINVGE